LHIDFCVVVAEDVDVLGNSALKEIESCCQKLTNAAEKLQTLKAAAPECTSTTIDWLGEEFKRVALLLKTETIQVHQYGMLINIVEISILYILWCKVF